MYGAAPTTYPAIADSQPEENFSFCSNGLLPDATPYPADLAAHYWPWPSHSSAPAEQYDGHVFGPLPPCARNAPPPPIRLQTNFPSANISTQWTPQDTPYPSASTSSNFPTRDECFDNYSSIHLSPQYTRPMAQMSQPQDIMRAPVSPISVHSANENATLAELLSPRKRSYTEMRGDAVAALPLLPSLQSGHIEDRSRDNSIGSLPPKSASPPGEDFSPRGSRSFKRGNPPQNHNNKYICTFDAACADQVFDRKCEWR